MRPITLLLAATIALGGVTTVGAIENLSLDDTRVYRNGYDGFFRRSDVWDMAPDGTFSGVYSKSRSIARGGVYTVQGDVEGRWRLEGDDLCVEGRGLEAEGEICHRLTERGATDLRREFLGESARSGKWQLFVYQ